MIGRVKLIVGVVPRPPCRVRPSARCWRKCSWCGACSAWRRCSRRARSWRALRALRARRAPVPRPRSRPTTPHCSNLSNGTSHLSFQTALLTEQFSKNLSRQRLPRRNIPGPFKSIQRLMHLKEFFCDYGVTPFSHPIDSYSCMARSDR